MKNAIKIGIIGFFCASLTLLSSCGTLQGFGQDVSSTGRVIQKAAS